MSKHKTEIEVLTSAYISVTRIPPNQQAILTRTVTVGQTPEGRRVLLEKNKDGYIVGIEID